MFIDTHMHEMTCSKDSFLKLEQMVEIARATSDPDVKMMVLDEPTSSLPAEQTSQLQDYIKKSAKEQGIAYIYISHRLKEIMFWLTMSISCRMVHRSINVKSVKPMKRILFSAWATAR